MATYTLTGDFANRVGDPLTNGGTSAPRAWLVPYSPVVTEGGEVRVGTVELTLNSTTYAFTQAGIPGGVYAVALYYRDPNTNQMVRWQSDFFVLASSSDLSTLLLNPPYGGEGSTEPGVVLLSSANSGTAYTVTAATHGEKRVKLTLTGSATLTLSGGTSGEVCAVQLHLIQDATGSRTVSWPGNLDWGTAGAPVLSTATGKIDAVYLTTDDGGSSWLGALIGSGY